LALANAAWDDLTTIRDLAERAKARLSRNTGPKLHARRGPPFKPERDSLTYDVAVILRVHEVSTVRSPKFRRVMETVLTEAYGKAPIDLSHLLKPASDAVEAQSLEDCRRYLQMVSAVKCPD
jgi:hypothetical protein